MAHSGDAEPTRSSVGVHIRPLTLADWRELRALRLRALEDAPGAFLSDGTDESSRTERAWRETFRRGVWLVAVAEREPVGLARMLCDGVEVPHIESVWTAPDHRRRGIATALIRWLIDRYRALGATEIRLWVLDANHDARRLYESLGFEPTGERQPVDEHQIEERLRLNN